MNELPSPLVLATRNVDKTREIIEILVQHTGDAMVAYAIDIGPTTIGFLLASPDDIAAAVSELPVITAEPDVEETGTTLEENARLKAAALAAATRPPAPPGDTGLGGGAPGGAPRGDAGGAPGPH